MIASASRKGLRNYCVHHWSRRQLIATFSSKSAHNRAPEFIESRHCWKCGSVLHHDCSLFCESTECGVIQELDQDGCNYFRLFGLEERFDLDDSVVETKFKNLQRLLHPDKFATKSNPEIERSNHNSSIVNQAYQVCSAIKSQSSCTEMIQHIGLACIRLIQQEEFFSDMSFVSASL
jgi:hypothetical protein